VQSPNRVLLLCCPCAPRLQVPCSASRVVPGAHRVVGPDTHRGSGPREVHTTVSQIGVQARARHWATSLAIRVRQIASRVRSSRPSTTSGAVEPSRNCSSPPPATPRSATHSTHNSLCLPSAVVKALEPAALVEAAAYPSPTSLMTTKSCIVFHLHKTTTLWDTRAELAESPSNSKRRHLPPCSRSRRTSVGDAVGTAVEAEGHSVMADDHD
jgi:hypothetical protein